MFFIRKIINIGKGRKWIKTGINMYNISKRERPAPSRPTSVVHPVQARPARPAQALHAPVEGVQTIGKQQDAVFPAGRAATAFRRGKNKNTDRIF